jgi:hypothetical protein
MSWMSKSTPLLAVVSEQSPAVVDAAMSGLKVKDPIRAKLERYELIRPLGPSHFYRTIHAALDAYEERARETSGGL